MPYCWVCHHDRPTPPVCGTHCTTTEEDDDE
jgi:hypothetical protein